MICQIQTFLLIQKKLFIHCRCCMFGICMARYGVNLFIYVFIYLQFIIGSNTYGFCLSTNLKSLSTSILHYYLACSIFVLIVNLFNLFNLYLFYQIHCSFDKRQLSTCSLVTLFSIHMYDFDEFWSSNIYRYTTCRVRLFYLCIYVNY